LAELDPAQPQLVYFHLEVYHSLLCRDYGIFHFLGSC